MNTFEVNYAGQQYTVSVEKNKSITIGCTYKNVRNPQPTKVTLNVGDHAEYDSYNLRYLSPIKSISEKCVCFENGILRRSSKVRTRRPTP